MKNASQIITSIQYKPQFKKVLDYKCISKLISIILPSLQKSIKHGFIHKNIFYITITASLNKYDKDNIINTIKMVLNSKMILEEKGFVECNNIEIDDIIVYVDHKPKIPANLHMTNAHTLTYHERASGNIEINIKDKKLNSLAKEIQEMIKKEVHDT
jgi:hypothetical protein